MLKWLNRKAKISIRIPRELLPLYKQAARRMGLPIESWAVRVLNSVLPSGERKELSEEVLKAAGLTVIYSNGSGEDLIDRTPPDHAVLVPGHPCVYLSSEYPVGMSGRYCVGSCRKQGGRPCYWSAEAAKMCPVYKPKISPPSGYKPEH